MPRLPRWPNRKLTSAEGERILWHVLGHIINGRIEWVWSPEQVLDDTLNTIRNLLAQFS